MLLNVMNDAPVLSEMSNANSYMRDAHKPPLLIDTVDNICVEPSQKRQRRVRFQDPPQRRVHFPEVEWQEIVGPEPLYDEADKQLLWYQDAELCRFKGKNKKLIHEYRLVMKHIDQSSLVPLCQNHYANKKRQLEDNLRGLEDYKCKSTIAVAKKRRVATMRFVLLEQRYQKQNSFSDPERIREVSLSTTSLNALIAYTKGKMDEMYVIETYKL